jgi:actin-related protein
MADLSTDDHPPLDPAAEEAKATEVLSGVKTDSAAAAKKRKRPMAATSSSSKPSVIGSPPPETPPPTKILILDNGGDTVKYGWSDDDDKGPRGVMPNITGRLPQQWTVLVGDQLQMQTRNPNQLVNLTRSTERGILVNFGNQVQVWKRILDVLGVAVPVHTDAAQAFGWNNKPAGQQGHNKKQTTTTTQGSSEHPKKKASDFIAPSTCAVLIALPPHCPRSVLDQIAHVWMEDFGFAHVGFCVSTSCARREHALYKTCLTVDLGWSATHVVPTVQGNVMVSKAIRRMPIGGRHLINLWKYYASYRQWNLMEQEWILRDVLEKTGYVALDFKEQMQLARRVVAGRRPYDREYVLPDYQETFTGSVRLPPMLLKRLERDIYDQGEEGDDNDDDDDSSVDERDLLEEDVEDDGMEVVVEPSDQLLDDKDLDDAVDDDDDDEEETVEQVRARLLKQRAEEEKRRREMEQEQQVLNLSVERFAVPEVLFRPSDANLPAGMAGLAETIVQSIEACEEMYQPALYQSIHLVGGLSQLDGLEDRLQQELRSLAPCQYTVGVTSAESPIEQAWLGARAMSVDVPFEEWSFSRHRWEVMMCKRGAWKVCYEHGHFI